MKKYRADVELEVYAEDDEELRARVCQHLIQTVAQLYRVNPEDIGAMMKEEKQFSMITGGAHEKYKLDGWRVIATIKEKTD